MCTDGPWGRAHACCCLRSCRDPSRRASSCCCPSGRSAGLPGGAGCGRPAGFGCTRRGCERGEVLARAEQWPGRARPFAASEVAQGQASSWASRGPQGDFFNPGPGVCLSFLRASPASQQGSRPLPTPAGLRQLCRQDEAVPAAALLGQHQWLPPWPGGRGLRGHSTGTAGPRHRGAGRGGRAGGTAPGRLFSAGSPCPDPPSWDPHVCRWVKNAAGACW